MAGLLSLVSGGLNPISDTSKIGITYQIALGRGHFYLED